MKILVFIDHMKSGGAARVTSIMCNGLTHRGYEVILAYNCQKGTLYECDPTIKKFDTYVSRRGKSHLAGVRLLQDKIKLYRSIIKQIRPDIIVGVEPEPYFCAQLANVGLRIPLIAVDHTSYRRKQHWFTRWIRWRAYRRATRVSILSHVDEKIVGNRLPNKQVVHNPISFPILDTNVDREKIILCVGRKDAWEVKGFDRMLRMWQQIRAEYPEWSLVFAGVSGEEERQIRYLGEVQDMQSLYQRASIFALPSRIEGFPMCLLEAGAQGCACVSFALGGVAAEILTDGQSGRIVDDDNEQQFIEALTSLIMRPQLREAYSSAIRIEMREFVVETFIDKWEQLCDSLYVRKDA